MSTAMWMNLPLMVIAFGLVVGIPLWMVLRHPDWHGKRQAHPVPDYLTRGASADRARVRVPRPASYDRARTSRPAGANGYPLA